MTDLVRSLLDYSKINLPGFTLNKIRVSPAGMVDDVYERNVAVISRQGFRFKKAADADIPPLGLAICGKIAELHGAKISYTRENGKTIFSFNLQQNRERKMIEEMAHTDKKSY